LLPGVAQLVAKVDDLLARRGVSRIKTEGLRFDPLSMEALQTAEAPAEQDGMVLEEIRPGYQLGVLVIRPAGVKVAVSRPG
jgi:molecular chaperone GrpE